MSNEIESLLQDKLAELINSNEQLNATEKHNIGKAFEMAQHIFTGKTLEDGFPVILFNLEVALIAMQEIGLGPTSGICSLLYNNNLNSDYKLEKLEGEFGHRTASIFEGFQKISNLTTEKISSQSDAIRTLMLSMVGDIRVILIKLALCLNSLRRLSSYASNQKQVVEEAKYIYIPIAHLLGLYKIKTEMEERVMLFEVPDIYNQISRKIRETKAKREVYILEFIKPIEKELKEQRFNFEIKWRTKSIHSIWEKMKRQNVEFEEVFDLFAIRVILMTTSEKEKEACWRVFSIITHIYNSNPDRMRDWITTPKSTGYESLHATVKSHHGMWIEVQIRTKRMDDIAEKGQAAHWQYKGVSHKKETEKWLTQVREYLQTPGSLEPDTAYLNHRDTKSDNVFVFTPKGDLKSFPAGSTILDFAFEIHTDIGSKCSGARVNNKVVPIRYTLKNGDRIDILTSKNQKPKLDWLAFVTTERARNKIRRKLKEEKFREAEIGKDVLLRKIKNWKLKYHDELINYLVKHYKLDTSVDLYFLIAEEKIDLSEIKKLLTQFSETDVNKKQDIELTVQKNEELQESYDEQEIFYIGDNLKNVNYRLAKCCGPIPGDDVFGFVTSMGVITIHRNNCPNSVSLHQRFPYRLMQIKWLSRDESSVSIANLRIEGVDQLGIVGAITKVITDDFHVNMRSISFQNKGKRFDGKVSLMIKNNEHLNQLIHKIGKVKGVEKVLRIK